MIGPYMTHWFDRLERRLDFLSIPGLAGFLAAMNAAVGVMSFVKPEFPAELDLVPELVLRGQVWRLFTFLFIPPAVGPIWLLLWLMLFYAYARALEQAWGDFKFTLYCAVGAAAAGGAAFALGRGLPNTGFNMSLFLAFARLHPEFEVLLFFILPVRMRWLAWAAWALLAWNFALGGFATRLALAAGIANYLLFFGDDIRRDVRRLLRRW